jgi:hypothetical protein
MAAGIVASLCLAKFQFVQRQGFWCADDSYFSLRSLC